MTWRIQWTDPALKESERLDARAKARILASLERLAETGRGDARRLHGGSPEWRLRVGSWRVRFEYDFEAREIVVLHVLPRGRAYRR